MTDKKKTQESSSTPDLSVLAGFQFGPAWAKPNAPKEYSSREMSAPREHSHKEFGRDRKFAPRDGGRRRDGGERKGGYDRERRQHDSHGDRQGRPGRFSNNNRGERSFTERKPLPEPAAGLRVELRPVDIGLVACTAEVNKHKRVVSLYDFAKIIMGKKERYDLVFMKQEGGPELFCSNKGDHACWLTREEAVKHLWKAGWFDEFYETVTEDAEPPSGSFTAIGKCSLNGELIGPVNWHGYQVALLTLHRTKYAHMDIDRFKSKIQTEKGEEVVQAWLETVSKKTAWRPRREGASETVLEDAAAVEKDFSDNHFDDVYTVCDKVFINGAVSRTVVSPGLWAHIATMSDATRKHPSMLIPNLCHGLARHHMPIFKWKGGHHTGPSRPRTLASDTVLADRLMMIINWVESNQGKRVDVMLRELCGSHGQTASESAVCPVVEDAQETAAEPVAEESASEPVAVSGEEAAKEAPGNTPAPVAGVDQERQDFVKDLFWLCDQGYVLVFADGRINLPKVPARHPETANASDKEQAPKVKKTSKPKKKNEPKPEKAKESAQKEVVETSEPVAVESGPVEEKAVEPAEQAEATTEKATEE